MAAGTLVVLQPGYLPWLGFFDQMQRSSVFIYYDDVQFNDERLPEAARGVRAASARRSPSSSPACPP